MAHIPGPQEQANGLTCAQDGARQATLAARPLRQGPATTLDITETFTKASRELHDGQLVKDETFTLFDSVAALEIMDPKMDSGMASDQDLILEHFDPFKHVQPVEIIAIMDQLLCFEIAWHAGSPLSQTLFTSLHLHFLLSFEPRPLDKIKFRNNHGQTHSNRDAILVNIVLRAFCLAITKSCDIAIDTIIHEVYFEEEDIATQTFNVDLLTNVRAESIVKLLEQAKAALEEIHIADDMRNALVHRLELQRVLLEAFDLDAHASNDDRPESSWQSILPLLSALDSNHPTTSEEVLRNCFSDRIQRFLASNAPPRTILAVDWSKSLSQLRTMCSDMTEAYRVRELLPRPHPHALLLFAWSFASRKPQPLTYPRAILQRLLLREQKVMGTLSHMDLLITDLHDTVLGGHPILSLDNWADHPPTDPRHLIARKVEAFIEKIQTEYINIYVRICQNKCRIRRTLAQSISILDNLQALTEDIDNDLREICNRRAEMPLAHGSADRILQSDAQDFYPLSAWVFYQKLRAMEWVMQLGFELDVYQRDEMAEMYTMLSHFAQCRYEQLLHIQDTLVQRMRRIVDLRLAQNAKEIESSLGLTNIWLKEAGSVMAFSRALGLLYSLLNTLGIVESPDRPYSTERLRYEVRFKSYLSIGTPPLLDQEALHEASHFPRTTAVQVVFENIEHELKTAKVFLTKLKSADAKSAKFEGCEAVWLSKTQSLLMSAIACGVATATLKSACATAGIADFSLSKTVMQRKLKVDMAEQLQRYHDWWPVPKLTTRT